MPAWGAIASAAAPYVSSAMSMMGGNSANSQNRRLQREAQRFALDMDNTKHQRQVEDLKKAGLNPMLSQMNGASVPSLPSTPTMQDVITPAINSANATRMTSAQSEQLNAATEQALAAAARERSTTDLNSAQASEIRARTQFEYGDHGSATFGGDTTVTVPNNSMLRWQQNAAEVAKTKAQTDFTRATIQEVVPRINQMAKDGDLKEASALLARTNAKATQLGLPKIQAEGEIYKGVAGSLLPYIPAISQGVGTAYGVKQLLRSGKSPITTHSYKSLHKEMERRANDY